MIQNSNKNNNNNNNNNNTFIYRNKSLLLSHRSRRQGSWVGDDIMEKAFTWRFGFDASELRNFNVNQKQSNGECLMGMFMALLCYIGRDDSYSSQGVVYTYRREASRCSFRLTGQCEGLEAWSEQQVLASRFFYLCGMDCIRLMLE